MGRVDSGVPRGQQERSRRVCMAREARSMAPKAPRPRSGLGTRLFNFFRVLVFVNEECLASTQGVI